MFHFKENYNVFRFHRGPAFSRGPSFSGGGGGVGRGIKMLILKETNRTCDFQGGSDPCPLC